jgi:hypothetical protein
MRTKRSLPIAELDLCGSFHGSFYPRGREWQIAQSLSGGVGDCIRECRGGGPLASFSGTQERLSGAIYDMDVDRVGYRAKAQDRIRYPIKAGDPMSVKCNLLM